MSTTALLVEMVIIGLQAAIWITLLLLSTMGFTGINLSEVKAPDWSVALIGFGVCYTLGIVFDAATAWLEDQYKTFWEKRTEPHRKGAITYEERKALREGVLLLNPDVTTHLDNAQYRLRLLRSTFCNVGLIAIFGSLLIWKIGTVVVELKVFYTFLLFGFAAVSFYAWKRRLQNYRDSRDAFYSLLKKDTRCLANIKQRDILALNSDPNHERPVISK